MSKKMKTLLLAFCLVTAVGFTACSLGKENSSGGNNSSISTNSSEGGGSSPIENTDCTVTKPDTNGIVFTGADKVAYGEDYSFTISFASGYEAGEAFSVKANGIEVVYSDEASAYVVENVTETLVIVVEGVREKSYAVTFACAEYADAILNTADTYKATTNEYTFSISLGEVYTQCKASIEVYYSVGDGEETLLTAKDGIYSVENPQADITITVKNVSLNKYKVEFVANGEVKYTVSEVIVNEWVSEEQLAAAETAVKESWTGEFWGWDIAEEGNKVTADMQVNAILASPISTVDDFKAMSKEGNYYLANDIDISGDNTIVEFSGIFDGKGKTITSTYGATGDNAKMFTNFEGTVKDLNMNIRAGGYVCNASSIAFAMRDGLIENVTVNLTVSTRDDNSFYGTSSGLVTNFFGGTIKDCVVNMTTPNNSTEKDLWVGAVSYFGEPLEGMVATLSGVTVNVAANAEINLYGKVNDGVTVQPVIENCLVVKEVLGDIILEQGIGGATLSTEGVPAGYEKVYTKNGFAQGDFADFDLWLYKEVKFQIKVTPWILLSGWSIYNASCSWLPVTMTRTSDGWTVNVNAACDGAASNPYTFTSAADNLKTVLTAWYSDKGEAIVYITEIRGTADENATPPPEAEKWETKVLDSALNGGTASNESVPDGYESVTALDIAGNPFSTADVSSYSEIRFGIYGTGDNMAFDANWSTQCNAGMWHYITLVKQTDGTWTATFDRTAQGSEVATLTGLTGNTLTEILDWQGTSANGFLSTEIRGIV